MPSLPARYGRWGPILAPVVMILLILHMLHANFGSNTMRDMVEPAPGLTIDNPDEAETQIPSCPTLLGMEDILVVLKTGITEARDKVPVHLRTTLRCVPHKIIVSDFEEAIAGIQTHDVIRNVSDTLKQSNQDFALYNRARSGGRQALTSQDHTKVTNGPSGMKDNPGWKLDKWKFLPMIHTARRAQPDAKWFVFLEADTYPIWPNLLGWLANFDPEDRLYLGNQMQIGTALFAHGGSGFVLSHAAIHAVADFHQLHTDEWDEITNREWAGDCVLGMALAAAGVGLTWSWPHVTTQSVWEQDMLHENYGKKPWCHAPFTFHHMTPADVDRFWEFEQQWFERTNSNVLTYSDIFRNLIRPTLADNLDNWDNFADIGEGKEDYHGPTTPASIVACADYCAADPECVQYRLTPDSRCTTSKTVLRGKPRPGMRSGTMLWRVDAAVQHMEKCEGARWVTR
ncbi:uncharacterized protein N7515_009540 [Penicillium bovifimosum]|uniref:N-acetylgalactosaminide beta-1,3-galactosyltransferase n=1 Tax=Penicillium bovifimosum TaxID=126998 RepID=A0A9W9GJQ3_9EURO|nr:uncharacterized protein N7515_009540 [Penicillium bovifimosum]KAJ5121579.1 hypothetical protein N7515_009540 [Penicillium bovifimosum]